MKGFFRRCITQGMNHQCTNNQQCEMTPFSRNSCQFCRLKKCFLVGMSREASRLGRRPKRPKDEKEMMAGMSLPYDSPSSAGTPNFLLNQTGGSTYTPNTTPHKPTGAEQPAPNNTNKETTPNRHTESALTYEEPKDKLLNKIKKEKCAQPPFKLDPSPNKTPAAVPPQQPQFQSQIHVDTNQKLLLAAANYNNDDKQQQQQRAYNVDSLTKSSSAQDVITNSLANGNTTMNNLPQPTSSFGSIFSRETSKEHIQHVEMLSKLITISDKHTSIERTNELEFIRTTLIESHCQIWPTTFDKIRKRYLERPPVRVSSKPSVCDNFLDAMVPLIMDVVKYCKHIPGFNLILQHDQVQLLKQGSFEVICVNSFMLVDAQNKLMLTPDMDYLMDASTIRTMPLGFFMSEVFDLGIQASPLKLTDSEIALFNAVLIMNPGNFLFTHT